MRSIAELKNVSGASLVIGLDKNSIPNLFQNNQAQKILFSVTLHGKYGAYAILK